MEEEIWKEIPRYSLYRVSNLGRVKSISRFVKHWQGGRSYRKEKILILGTNSGEYRCVRITDDQGVEKTKIVHKLVAMAFLNHIPDGYKSIVNHKDFNRQNNHVDNLEIITHRENANKKHIKSSSEYTGVCWDKSRNKWISHIYINGKNKYLGRFENELDASNAYESALKNL